MTFLPNGKNSSLGLMTNVSHEIKTPIAVILNSAEMMKNTALSVEEQQIYVDTIIQSSKKLSALITNILKLNKLEKQNIQPVIEEYDLCEQLCQCSFQFENLWEDRDRKLVNKTELTRLQRNFEDCMHQIDALEQSKTSRGMMISISIGIVGTIFMAALLLR